jgi:hypothetical protein
VQVWSISGLRGIDRANVFGVASHKWSRPRVRLLPQLSTYQRLAVAGRYQWP